MQFGLAHGSASKPWRIDVLAFGESFVEAYCLRIRVIVGGSLIEGLADDLHPRPLDNSGFDRIAKVNSVEAPARVHVENSGESRIEIDLGVRQPSQRALGHRA